ncbi:MAG: ABC transporter ATP-binding protein [Lachnospiraceae bacterium]|nr:ABC transporter ATP-binding protein [Lachnospiraceae bacterium]
MDVELMLDVKHLSVNFQTKQGTVHAVRDISFSLKTGEVLAIVGESGCGKSALCKAIMGLLPGNGAASGEVVVRGENLLLLKEKQKRKLRGSFFSMIFQDPLTALNPTMTIGSQIAEAIYMHQPYMLKEDVKKRVYELLSLVGIDQPELRAKQYSYEFSGGMRQRSVLAIALANNPQVLLADEPTTALDVTIQAQILQLLKEIQTKMQMATIFVSHDLRVVNQVADRVAVMYAGRIVEIGTREEIFRDPRHPYTWGLLQSLPEFSKGKEELATIPGMPPSLLTLPKGDPFAVRNEYALAIDYEEEPPLFDVSPTHQAATWLLHEKAPKVTFTNPIMYTDGHTHVHEKKKDTGEIVRVNHLTKEFRMPGKRRFVAVKDVSFSVKEGEIFGLVGESGSGKSTVARCLMDVYTDYVGEVFYDGIPVHDKGARKKYKKRLQMERQMIFQDSTSSLNQRKKISYLVTEPFRIQHIKPKRGSLEKEAIFQLSYVGIDEQSMQKYPGELSGGQRQRVAIARAVATDPKLLIADEPIAALDVSIQAQIINLFKHLQKEHGFSIIFIAHDLAMVEFLCDRVGVMKNGELVEVGDTAEIFANPKHAYTKELLAAVPKIHKEGAPCER